jgi:4-amino-4-deoxy-L-arabinose transferase-like glycosyltransferase
LLFGAILTIGAKKFDRYLLPVFPPLSLLSGMGWAALCFLIQEKFSKTFARFALPVLFLVIAGGQIYAAIKTFPYYLTYYNPVAGGSQRAPQAMLIGWGEGLDQAGRYLSQKPNSRRLRVLSWFPNGSLSYFFPGKVRPILSEDGLPEDFARLDTVTMW